MKKVFVTLFSLLVFNCFGQDNLQFSKAINMVYVNTPLETKFTYLKQLDSNEAFCFQVILIKVDLYHLPSINCYKNPPI